MSVIYYKDQIIELKSNQTVLEGLLDAGHDIPNACRAGACQSCKLQAVEGSPPPESQPGLSQAEKKLGYFLSCQCQPSEKLCIGDENNFQVLPAKVLESEKLNDKVLRLRLEPVFDFHAGQFFTIWFNKAPRSYSIASLPSSGYIECHIKLIEGGLFSPYAFEHLQVGDTLDLQDPSGTCIYSATLIEQPLLLASLGTGLAPIYGIACDAINKGHTGPIHIITGAKKAEDLYLQEELNKLLLENSNVNISLIAQSTSSSDLSVEIADIYAFCKDRHPSTKGYSIYLCGAQSFVNKLKKQCFLGGANMTDIYADAFVASGS